MSDTDKKRLVPVVLCQGCNVPMKIVASLPADDGMRLLSYKCDQCNAVETLQRKTDLE
jgi:hypothetical protein